MELRNELGDVKDHLIRSGSETNFSSSRKEKIKKELRELLKEIREEDAKNQGEDWGKVGQGNGGGQPAEDIQQHVGTPRDQTLTRLANGQVRKRLLQSPHHSANSIFQASELDISNVLSTID